MLLTDQERERFIQYLQLCAETSEGMAKEIAKLPGGGMEVLEKRERMKATAYRVILADLQSAEKMTL